MKKLLFTLQQQLKDTSLEVTEQVQSLWSGYGKIIRIMSSATNTSYIVKVVTPETNQSHPRGWGTLNSHQRKLRSYQVESHFYQHYAAFTDNHCKVPQLIVSTEFEGGVFLIMQDLDASGFSLRKESFDWPSLTLAIRWLAYFHAKFMDSRAYGVWPVGTYWHLATRQDEWQNMPAGNIKTNAELIDNTLSQAKFQTLVHGDAKLANFCFHNKKPQLAAVDFQYVGRGSGVKDLAYLVGSGLTQEGLTKYGELALEEYLHQLKMALSFYSHSVNHNELDAEIRRLYPIAWADFYRFLLGWNSNSWKICDYMKRMTEQGIKNLMT